MPRKHHSISDLLLQAPWWVSVVTAAIVYIVMGFIIPSIETNNQFLDIVFNAVAVPAPFFSIVFLLLAPLSFLNSRRKIELLNQQTNLNSIRKLHWKNFEELVAEAYRRLGYQVTEGGFGPDGGIDLELRKDGEVSLVQCKHWKTQKVGVNVIREMYGVLAASNATQINIICSGKFTQEAYSFAADKPIFLISGNELEALIRDIQSPVAKSEEKQAFCPRCGKDLVERVAKRGVNLGKTFLGCSNFPKCRYTKQT
ncbi:restriction endonuclease [Alteromonas gracilis]|uniref:DUF2034 domain-containing protein n=1 Tax=Alteromonas gracilis TaxID=1479524 RepID=A0ABX5CTD8_9ALTE|nr:restriction endonuclease [Alteromonas gracilis]PRO70218.1 DUF2034 domain-containing protein [Alteromonas gracilis]